MTTITQSIPSLGSPPLTSDPVNFDTRADTLYGTSLPAVITATNTWSGQANTVAGEVNTNATNAQTSANTATGASAAAIAAVNATQWVSGQAYVTGAVVWSPINFYSYRANTNTSGTTDPSISASWVSLNIIALGSQVTGTLPIANGGTGITSFGSGVATFLGTPSSANLAAAVTDETGSGALVFATSPTIASANLTTALTLDGAAGTNGQVLTSAGSGLPSWTTLSAGFTIGTPAATTSGTSITFTAIPAGTKQVIVTFKGVSTNGTSVKLVRIGPSGGVETSAYNGMQLHAYGGSLTRVFSSAGFLFGSNVASEVIHGSMTLTLQNSSTNSWVAHGGQSEAGQQTPYFNAGVKSLAGALSVLSITTDNGTDAFDAGEVNIAYI
jgi:hypothetical protein